MSEKTAVQIRELREAYDMGQEEFATRLGMSQGQLSKLERGHRDPDPLLEEILRRPRLRDHFLRGRPKIGGTS